jgi:NAD(P)-dependent dehydrogenase (short-subunit alcohol dehydrogenase family)
MSRAFAPVLAQNGGGAIANVLSVLSWLAPPSTGAYSASKAAMWAATNSMRQELQVQGTQVTAIHAGYIDTDMAAGVDGPKLSPDEVVAKALDGVESGAHEVLVDDISRSVRSALSQPLEALYPALASVAQATR